MVHHRLQSNALIVRVTIAVFLNGGWFFHILDLIYVLVITASIWITKSAQNHALPLQQRIGNNERFHLQKHALQIYLLICRVNELVDHTLGSKRTARLFWQIVQFFRICHSETLLLHNF